MSGYAAKGLKKRITVGVLALAGALLVAGPSSGQQPPPGGMMPHMKGPPCLNGGEMRRAVGGGRAKPLGAIMRRIGGGQIVRAKLCRRPGGLVYLVDVLKGARVEHLVIDARSGRIMMRR
ncbi:PepSY domain-containing protein [Breoghania sp.]|uniref:PepSY domain-containing protein n=1 Tax=Breoghania sp. TaxID=2065378 RepID=UPI002AA85EF9|nr:PepSY domain-containing protein [Breoghania sp.]